MKRLFAVLFVLVTAFSYAQQKYALVIGNGNYTSFGSLSNALNDANDMAAALQGLGFTVDKVLNGNRAQMVEGITRLKNRLSVSKASYGFFFYAGHGVQFNGVNYLIPAKADIPSANYLGETTVSLQSMLAELNDAGNELNIVVLDACRDFPAAWSRSTNRGLSVVSNQPADSIIVYATSAGSTAADGQGRNGLFTSQLLKNIKTPGLEVSEVIRRTGADVAKSSNRQQIPAVYNQFFGLAYLGSPPAAPAPAAKPAPQPAPTPAPQVQRAQPSPPAQTARVSLNRSQSAALKEACENLISNLPSNSTVAVWGVKSENTLLSAAVTDGIILNLVNSGRLRVVDPVNVSMIRRELGLQLNGEVSDDSLISLGKFLGADIVITGSINGSGSSQNLRLTATDTETASVSAGVSVRFK